MGQLAAILCLIELYAHAPDEDEVLACLGKLIAFRQKRARAFRQRPARKGRARPQPETFIKPFLWIITAGRPTAVLAELGALPAPGWPPGVYFSPALLRVGIVVASELPRNRSTLLVRLMAAGPLLAQAIKELSALPAEAHERAVAEQILLRLQHALRDKADRTAEEEEEFVVTMYSTWEQARAEGRNEGRAEGRNEGRAEGRKEGRAEGRNEGRAEGRAEGRNEGRAEEAARAVLTALRVRGIAVPDALRERILAQKDPERLERWLERAIVAASVDDLIDEPS